MKKKLIFVVVLLAMIQGILRTEPGSMTCITTSDCGIPGLICVDGYCVTPLDVYFEYSDYTFEDCIYHRYENCPTSSCGVSLHYAQYSYFREIISCHGIGNEHCIVQVDETNHNMDWAESACCTCENVSQ